MNKLQPIELIVESENSYRVRFKSKTGAVEFSFTMEHSPFPFLICDDEFLEITNGDPAADRLKEAICNFHQARNFEYASNESASK